MSDRILAFYKRFISPLFTPCCRFYPSCSEYSALCFKFHNPAIALLKTLTRLLRCNQLCKGGIEYVAIKHLPCEILRDATISRTIPRNTILRNSGGIKPFAFYFVPATDAKFFYIIKSLKG